MIARSIASAPARRRHLTVLGLLLAAGLAISCDRVPLTAPTESTIQLFSTAPSVPLNGSIDLVATITEQAGTPVPDGTLVSFTTTLGRIEPSETRTDNGKATVKLIAGTQSGTATVTAFSGAATSGGQADWRQQSTAGVEHRGRDWRGRRGRDRRWSAPSRRACRRPAARCRSSPRCSTCPAISSVASPSRFSTTAGQLSSSSAITAANGEARVTLTTSTAATVTARAARAETATSMWRRDLCPLSIALTADARSADRR